MLGSLCECGGETRESFAWMVSVMSDEAPGVIGV